MIFSVFEWFLLYSIKLYMGITTSKSSAFSINTLLIFETEEINGTIFLKANYLSITLSVFAVLIVVTIA